MKINMEHMPATKQSAADYKAFILCGCLAVLIPALFFVCISFAAGHSLREERKPVHMETARVKKEEEIFVKPEETIKDEEFIIHTGLVMTGNGVLADVHANPFTDSPKTGVLYSNCGGTILEQVPGWTKIVSGELTGWVEDRFLLFDEDARNKADEAGFYMASLKLSPVAIREKPGMEYSVTGFAYDLDSIRVIGFAADDWLKIVSDGKTGFIPGECVDLCFHIPFGETLKMVEKRKLNEAMVSVTSKLPPKADVSVRTKQDYYIVAQASGPELLTDVTDEEIRMLAAIIHCEAGNQSYEGKVAVGAVVMNRVMNDEFPDTIRDVILDDGQFSPVKNGWFFKIYCSGSWEDDDMQAALDALSGESPVDGALYFKNPATAGWHAGYMLGDHVFW